MLLYDFSSLPGGAAKDGVRPRARGVNINFVPLSGRRGRRLIPREIYEKETFNERTDK